MTDIIHILTSTLSPELSFTTDIVHILTGTLSPRVIINIDGNNVNFYNK